VFGTRKVKHSYRLPSVRKVAFDDLRRLLPADMRIVTSAEREQTIRDRRSRLQQRPPW
jgi:hypothetical protein